MLATKNQLALFIFRRDLRLADNKALIAALQNSIQVIPAFIFDPRQCVDNPYLNPHIIQFMLQSLEDLKMQLQKRSAQLYLWFGICEEVIEKLIAKNKIDAIYFNRDYTPFSKNRDENIAGICKKYGVQLYSYDDALLVPLEFTLKKDRKPYQIFSAFYRSVRPIPVEKPQKNNYINYYTGEIILPANHKILPHFEENVSVKGGRQQCIKILKNLSVVRNYSRDRDFPAKNATTHLSSHLKFTTCSVREIYHAIQAQVMAPDDLIRELYWRDFFTLIAYYYPHVLQGPFQRKYHQLNWQNNKKLFQVWCAGNTGFPIVDAGMRELNATGYMHNRVRLITASFLIKDLHIDWRWGEKYFAQKLLDYDPAVNNGNWQWVASTGTDAQPYFRIFNPWLQQKKFDKDCVYIKKWVAELRHLDNKVIHEWYKEKYHSLSSYPKPVVDHKQEAVITRELYNLA